MSKGNLMKFEVEEFGIGYSTEVNITLSNYSTLKSGAIAISPRLTRLEIDGYVQALKDDLDRIAVKAKAITQ